MINILSISLSKCRMFSYSVDVPSPPLSLCVCASLVDSLFLCRPPLSPSPLPPLSLSLYTCLCLSLFLSVASVCISCLVLFSFLSLSLFLSHKHSLSLLCTFLRILKSHSYHNANQRNPTKRGGVALRRSFSHSAKYGEPLVRGLMV